MSAARTLEGHALRTATRAFAKELVDKLQGAQGGVPTFFDNYWIAIVEQLERLDASKTWEENLAAMEGPSAVRLRNGLERLRLMLLRRAQGRFVSPEDRRAGAPGDARHLREVGDFAFLLSQGSFDCMTWKGMPVFKTSFDFSIYPMLLWELRPRTILELGSGTGSSALWMADILESQEIDGAVWSFDRNRPALTHPRVTFVQGDCMQIEALLDDAVLALPHPWLVIEDCHVNLTGIFARIDPYLREGDYVIVEDSLTKRDEIAICLRTSPNCYVVDTKYTDYFGRNATSAVDSIFVRA